MIDRIPEIPEHLKPFVRHALHSDGRVEVFSETMPTNSTNSTRVNNNNVRDYINSIRRGKGLPIIEP